jgi:hypothetical protein
MIIAQIDSKRLMYQNACAIHNVEATEGQENIPMVPAAATVL